MTAAETFEVLKQSFGGAIKSVTEGAQPWAVVFGNAIQQRDAGNAAAGAFAEFAFLELLVFFAILLVGFAYLWKRGDLEWVRSLKGQP